MKSDQGHLLTFIGSTPRIGTSVTAFSMAYRLAERLGLRVGYLCLNLKSSKLHRYLGIDDPQATLDQLRADLRSQQLTSIRLKESCCMPFKNVPLSVLFGNMLREQAELYLPEHIEHLLSIARRCFDFCVADVSAYWDNAATIVGVRECDKAILVTSNELDCFQEDVQRWLEQGLSLYSIPREKLLFWLNRSYEGTGGYSAKQVERELDLPMLGMHVMNRKLAKSVHEGKLDDAVLDGSWSKSIGEGVELLLRRLEWNLEDEERSETSFFRRFSLKKNVLMKRQKEMKGSV